MSKRDLKIFLKELTREQLEEQVVDLYDRYKEVKEFYNFAFNPQEQKLLEDAKIKISKEYIPTSGRKAKARRSVANKIIKHYLKLGVDVVVCIDIMLYAIEIAQTYSRERFIGSDVFYTSMQKNLADAIRFIIGKKLVKHFRDRVEKIVREAQVQHWPNRTKIAELMIEFNKQPIAESPKLQ